MLLLLLAVPAVGAAVVHVLAAGPAAAMLPAAVVAAVAPTVAGASWFVTLQT